MCPRPPGTPRAYMAVGSEFDYAAQKPTDGLFRLTMELLARASL